MKQPTLKSLKGIMKGMRIDYERREEASSKIVPKKFEEMVDQRIVEILDTGAASELEALIRSGELTWETCHPLHPPRADLKAFWEDYIFVHLLERSVGVDQIEPILRIFLEMDRVPRLLFGKNMILPSCASFDNGHFYLALINLHLLRLGEDVRASYYTSPSHRGSLLTMGFVNALVYTQQFKALQTLKVAGKFRYPNDRVAFGTVRFSPRFVAEVRGTLQEFEDAIDN